MAVAHFNVLPEHLNAWREDVARNLLKIDFRPNGDNPFRASIEPLFSGLRVVRMEHTPGRTFRDKELTRDGDDSYALIVSRGAPLDITHCGQHFQLGRNEATVLRNCDTGVVESAGICRYVSVIVPAHDIKGQRSLFDNSVCRHFARTSGRLRLVNAYVAAIASMTTGQDAVLMATLRQHLIDLMVLLVSAADGGAEPESSSKAMSAARMACIRQRVAASFADPDLGPAEVAAAEGLSERYLQRLLELQGTTFTAVVNDLRLQHARALFDDPSHRRRRILDIALSSGFSDLSHFNRLFKRRYGCTPSEIRAAGRA